MTLPKLTGTVSAGLSSTKETKSATSSAQKLTGTITSGVSSSFEAPKFWKTNEFKNTVKEIKATPTPTVPAPVAIVSDTIVTPIAEEKKKFDPLGLVSRFKRTMNENQIVWAQGNYVVQQWLHSLGIVKTPPSPALEFTTKEPPPEMSVIATTDKGEPIYDVPDTIREHPEYATAVLNSQMERVRNLVPDIDVTDIPPISNDTEIGDRLYYDTKNNVITGNPLASSNFKELYFTRDNKTGWLIPTFNKNDTPAYLNTETAVELSMYYNYWIANYPKIKQNEEQQKEIDRRQAETPLTPEELGEALYSNEIEKDLRTYEVKVRKGFSDEYKTLKVDRKTYLQYYGTTIGTSATKDWERTYIIQGKNGEAVYVTPQEYNFLSTWNDIGGEWTQEPLAHIAMNGLFPPLTSTKLGEKLPKGVAEAIDKYFVNGVNDLIGLFAYDLFLMTSSLANIGRAGVSSWRVTKTLLGSAKELSEFSDHIRNLKDIQDLSALRILADKEEPNSAKKKALDTLILQLEDVNRVLQDSPLLTEFFTKGWNAYDVYKRLREGLPKDLRGLSKPEFDMEILRRSAALHNEAYKYYRDFTSTGNSRSFTIATNKLVEAYKMEAYYGLRDPHYATSFYVNPDRREKYFYGLAQAELQKGAPLTRQERYFVKEKFVDGWMELSSDVVLDLSSYILDIRATAVLKTGSKSFNAVQKIVPNVGNLDLGGLVIQGALRFAGKQLDEAFPIFGKLIARGKTDFAEAMLKANLGISAASRRSGRSIARAIVEGNTDLVNGIFGTSTKIQGRTDKLNKFIDDYVDTARQILELRAQGKSLKEILEYLPKSKTIAPSFRSEKSIRTVMNSALLSEKLIKGAPDITKQTDALKDLLLSAHEQAIFAREGVTKAALEKMVELSDLSKRTGIIEIDEILEQAEQMTDLERARAFVMNKISDLVEARSRALVNSDDIGQTIGIKISDIYKNNYAKRWSKQLVYDTSILGRLANKKKGDAWREFRKVMGTINDVQSMLFNGFINNILSRKPGFAIAQFMEQSLTDAFSFNTGPMSRFFGLYRRNPELLEALGHIPMIGRRGFSSIMGDALAGSDTISNIDDLINLLKKYPNIWHPEFDAWSTFFGKATEANYLKFLYGKGTENVPGFFGELGLSETQGKLLLEAAEKEKDKFISSIKLPDGREVVTIKGKILGTTRHGAVLKDMGLKLAAWTDAGASLSSINDLAVRALIAEEQYRYNLSLVQEAFRKAEVTKLINKAVQAGVSQEEAERLGRVIGDAIVASEGSFSKYMSLVDVRELANPRIITSGIPDEIRRLDLGLSPAEQQLVLSDINRRFSEFLTGRLSNNEEITPESIRFFFNSIKRSYVQRFDADIGVNSRIFGSIAGGTRTKFPITDAADKLLSDYHKGILPIEYTKELEEILDEYHIPRLVSSDVKVDPKLRKLYDELVVPGAAAKTPDLSNPKVRKILEDSGIQIYEDASTPLRIKYNIPTVPAKTNDGIPLFAYKFPANHESSGYVKLEDIRDLITNSGEDLDSIRNSVGYANEAFRIKRDGLKSPILLCVSDKTKTLLVYSDEGLTSLLAANDLGLGFVPVQVVKDDLAVRAYIKQQGGRKLSDKVLKNLTFQPDTTTGSVFKLGNLSELGIKKLDPDSVSNTIRFGKNYVVMPPDKLTSDVLDYMFNPNTKVRLIDREDIKKVLTNHNVDISGWSANNFMSNATDELVDIAKAYQINLKNTLRGDVTDMIAEAAARGEIPIDDVHKVAFDVSTIPSELTYDEVSNYALRHYSNLPLIAHGGFTVGATHSDSEIMDILMREFKSREAVDKWCKELAIDEGTNRVIKASRGYLTKEDAPFIRKIADEAGIINPNIRVRKVKRVKVSKKNIDLNEWGPDVSSAIGVTKPFNKDGVTRIEILNSLNYEKSRITFWHEYIHSQVGWAPYYGKNIDEDKLAEKLIGSAGDVKRPTISDRQALNEMRNLIDRAAPKPRPIGDAVKELDTYVGFNPAEPSQKIRNVINSIVDGTPPSSFSDDVLRELQDLGFRVDAIKGVESSIPDNARRMDNLRRDINTEKGFVFSTEIDKTLPEVDAWVMPDGSAVNVKNAQHSLAYLDPDATRNNGAIRFTTKLDPKDNKTLDIGLDFAQRPTSQQMSTIFDDWLFYPRADVEKYRIRLTWNAPTGEIGAEYVSSAAKLENAESIIDEVKKFIDAPTFRPGYADKLNRRAEAVSELVQDIANKYVVNLPSPNIDAYRIASAMDVVGAPVMYTDEEFLKAAELARNRKLTSFTGTMDTPFRKDVSQLTVDLLRDAGLTGKDPVQITINELADENSKLIGKLHGLSDNLVDKARVTALNNYFRTEELFWSRLLKYSNPLYAGDDSLIGLFGLLRAQEMINTGATSVSKHIAYRENQQLIKNFLEESIEINKELIRAITAGENPRIQTIGEYLRRWGIDARFAEDGTPVAFIFTNPRTQVRSFWTPESNPALFGMMSSDTGLFINSREMWDSPMNLSTTARASLYQKWYVGDTAGATAEAIQKAPEQLKEFFHTFIRLNNDEYKKAIEQITRHTITGEETPEEIVTLLRNAAEAISPDARHTKEGIQLFADSIEEMNYYVLHKHILKDRDVGIPVFISNLPDSSKNAVRFSLEQMGKVAAFEDMLSQWEGTAIDTLNRSGIAPARVAQETLTAAEDAIRESAAAMKGLQDTLWWGGKVGDTPMEGAIPFMKQRMRVPDETAFDETIKTVIPFWNFATRGSATWLRILSENPTLAFTYAKYMKFSRSMAIEQGLVDRHGNPLSSTVGKIPLPGTGVWIDPFSLSPFMHYFFKPNGYENDSDLPEKEGLDLIGDMILMGRIRGIRMSPILDVVLTSIGVPDAFNSQTGTEKLISYGINTVFPLDLIPPFATNMVENFSRKNLFPSFPDTWKPKVQWFDYLVESNMTADYLQKIRMADSQDAKFELVKELEDAIREREESEIWNSYYARVQNTEYFKTLAGWFTGIYPRMYTPAESELLKLRGTINLLRDSINNEVAAQVFFPYKDAVDIYNLYSETRYETPEGKLWSIRGAFSWAEDANGNPAVGEERRKIINKTMDIDNLTEQYYSDRQTIYNTYIQEMKVVPVGMEYRDPRAVAARTKLFSSLRALEFSTAPEARRAWTIGYKPQKLIDDHYRSIWWDILSQSRPSRNYNEFESYADWMKRVEEWEKNLPKLAQEMAGIFAFNVFAGDLETRVPDQQILGVIPRLVAETTPEGYLAWDMSRDTVVDAAARAWETLYSNKYFEEVDGLKGNIREAAERAWLRTHKPPTADQLVKEVMRLYGDRFTEKEIRDAIGDKKISDVETAKLSGKSEDEKYFSKTMDLYNWLEPNQRSAFSKEFAKLGGDPGIFDLLWRGMSTKAFKPGELEKLYKDVKATIDKMGVKPPDDARLAKLAKAQQLNDEVLTPMLEQALGKDYKTEIVDAYYNGKDDARVKKGFELYQKIRKQFAAQNPLWAEVYLGKKTSSYYGTSGGSGYSGGGGGGVSVESVRGGKLMPIGNRGVSANNVSALLSPSNLGKGGVAGMPQWSEDLWNQTSFTFRQELYEYINGELPLSKAAIAYLRRLAERNPQDAPAINEFLSTVSQETVS